MHSENPLSYLLLVFYLETDHWQYLSNLQFRRIKAVFSATSATMDISTLLLTVTLSLATAQDPCDVFTSMSCPITEVNLIETVRHNVTDTTECQTWWVKVRPLVIGNCSFDLGAQKLSDAVSSPTSLTWRTAIYWSSATSTWPASSASVVPQHPRLQGIGLFHTFNALCKK